MFCFKLLQALNREAQKEWDMYIYIYVCVCVKKETPFAWLQLLALGLMVAMSFCVTIFMK